MGAEQWNSRSTLKKTCCIDCAPPERFPGCSATCEKKKRYDEEHRKRKEYLHKDDEVRSYGRDFSVKYVKRSGKK